MTPGMALANENHRDGTLQGHGFVALCNADEHPKLEEERPEKSLLYKSLSKSRSFPPHHLVLQRLFA